MVLPLFIICCYSLFLLFFLCLVFVRLISMCLHMFLVGFMPYWTLCLLGLIDYFLFHVGKIFNYTFFKNCLVCLLFLFFFCDPCNTNVGAFYTVSEVSKTILSSLHSIYSAVQKLFSPCYFQLTDWFLCLRYSVIDYF